jgi:hypothetical protein
MKKKHCCPGKIYCALKEVLPLFFDAQTAWRSPASSSITSTRASLYRLRIGSGSPGWCPHFIVIVIKKQAR